MKLQEYLLQWTSEDHVSTEDVLGHVLPLVRETIAAHRAGFVAPLVGIEALNADQGRIWFEEASRSSLRDNAAAIRRVEQPDRRPVEVLAEGRRIADIDEGTGKVARLDIAERGTPIVRPVYLPGYIAWEHELEHHDPLTDVFSLGMLLATLACQINLNEPADLESFVVNRRNLFALNSRLHPTLAQAILRMTELSRHRRAQDLPALLHSLENYRDQAVSLEIDLAGIAGFRTRDVQTRQQVVLTKLRDRLFDLSKRNNLLHFRPTMQSINLTQASMPLMLDIRNIREDQVLVWNESLRQQLGDGKPISLNKHLNFNEALYLPSLLERIIADARRDLNEFGFAQLRLAVCFLSWANLKERPIEQFVSPLVLVPVRLVKNKGIRDTFSLIPLSAVGEINPVLRHQFRQLYNIELPESIDLETSRLETLHEFLSLKIQASEPAVSLTLVDRPRIDLIHEKAKRRLDQYRKSARVSGRGVRHFGNLDYSYDPVNYHPLGIKLFSLNVRAPSSHLRAIIEDRPRPRSFAASESPEKAEDARKVIEAERSFYHLRDSIEANPYLWNFDLCNVTLANFHYRRMSLVRDYERILEANPSHAAFEAIFSLAPRPVGQTLPDALPLDERFDVVPCDPTQSIAIAEARRGANYIIQGPPGTGKSQTITNLIADFVARGKRVLFVCEKRAAIDVVYARLRQCGLGPLCSLIHDSQTDKKEFIADLKQSYEQYSADGSDSKSRPRKRTGALRKLRENLAPLAAFESLMESAVPDCDGLTTRRFLDRCIELLDQRPPLSPEELERFPNYDLWWRHAERLANLDNSIRYLEPSGVLARHPLKRLDPKLAHSERPIETVSMACKEALAALESMRQAIKQSGIPSEQWDSLSRARQILSYAKAAAPIAHGGNLSIVDSNSDRAREFSGGLQKVREAAHALEVTQKGTVAWREKLAPQDLRAALELAKRWEGGWFSWLTPAWWKMRSVLRRRYDFKSHAVEPSWLHVLNGLQAEYDAGHVWEQHVREVQTRFDLTEDPLAFDDRIEQMRRALQRMPEWLRRIHVALAKSPKAETFIDRSLVVDDPTMSLSKSLSNIVIDVDDLSLEGLRREIAAVQSSARQVPSILGVLSELSQLPSGIGAALRNAEFTVSQAESAIAYRTWGQLTRSRHELNQVDEQFRERTAARLESCYDRWQSANAAEISHRVRQRFIEHIQISNVSVTQLSAEQREFKRSYSQGRRTLEHEFGKSMRYKAIRELVEGDAAHVIRDLKPVWLMSPLSVSDTLPLDLHLFDVVIFDEASQVPLEESVPTLFRGAHAIVVGDEMQLPPTDFFTAKQTHEEDESFVEESGQRVNYDLDSDSLLNHAARNLPSTMLGWHYRSRSESLISFSNWAFYDGRLLTVPEQQLLRSNVLSPTELPGVNEPVSGISLLASRPVSFHYLKDGVYEDRQNRREARYVVTLVADLLKKRDGLSIGVIAFSEAQQSAIESALTRLAQDDEEFQALYDAELEREVDGQFVGLLVKNLENIQGDERDVIILSICYGPGPNGRMLMNFGPINKSGGEKRLNVAFSRAKRHMAVVSSIQHVAITNDYNDGAACLKNYLRYVEGLSTGDVDAAKRVLKGITRWHDANSETTAGDDDHVCRQLASTLRQRGYVVDSNVGQSHFRVDLAVRGRDEPSYRLGIMVDTQIKYEQSDALEREMMRPRLLKSFGWRLSTVLAKDWYLDRSKEIERILALLERSDGDGADVLEDIDEDESDFDDEPNGESAPNREVSQGPSDELLNFDDVDADHHSVQNSSESSATSALPMTTTAEVPQVTDGSVKYLEFRDDRSSKFWEISLQGDRHTVRFGRIGTEGQSQTKIFPDRTSAERDADRLVREKTRKGYREPPIAKS